MVHSKQLPLDKSSSTAGVMYRHLNLPPFVELRKVTGSSRTLGLFASKPIERGTRLFSRRIHASGIGGKTLNDVRSICHHCLESLDAMSPLVCRDCKIASYCSHECMESNRPLHRVECNGMIELEKLRGKETIEYPRPSSLPDDVCEYWPPAHALLAARVINKGIMTKDQEACDWMDYATVPDTLPPSKVQVFTQLQKYVRFLVPEEIKNDEIKTTLRAVSFNTATVERRPNDTDTVEHYTKTTMIVAVYNQEYALLHHMCKPNCEAEKEIENEDGKISVYTSDDIEAGAQLGISFLMIRYYANVRDIRLPKLKECFGIDCKCHVCTGEMERGSYFWLVDKQKSSLIAPWSFEMAHKAMIDGWNIMGKSSRISLVGDTAMLQRSLDTMHVYLDQRNVMILLTAIALFYRYCLNQANQDAIEVFFSSIGHVGLFALFQYGTRREVAELAANLSICFLEKEEVKGFNSMFNLARQIHPRRPSFAELGKMLRLSPPPFLSVEDLDMKKELDDVATRAARLGIPNEFAQEQMLQLMECMPGGRPDIPEACQGLLDIEDTITMEDD